MWYVRGKYRTGVIYFIKQIFLKVWWKNSCGWHVFLILFFSHFSLYIKLIINIKSQFNNVLRFLQVKIYTFCVSDENMFKFKNLSFLKIKNFLNVFAWNLALIKKTKTLIVHDNFTIQYMQQLTQTNVLNKWQINLKE